jgi:dolichol-phosphate mannosyltransferase
MPFGRQPGALGHALTAVQLLAGAVVAVRLSRGRVRRPALRAGPAVPPAATVSAVVPARDEERRLAPCLRDLLADADLLEVLVVDDCSADGTGRLAQALGARVIAGSPPPPGWAGKAWALQQGIEAARGEWILHLDADARPRPRLAGAMLAAAQSHGDDLLSAGPAFRCAGAADLVLHASFLATLPYRFGPGDAAGRRPGHARTVANGQCVLLPRRRFLAAGGYARVRGNLTEDVAIARSLAREGWAVGFCDAAPLLEVEMYSSARETWRGWGRSIAAPDATGAAWQLADVATLWLTLALPLLRAVAGRATAVDALLLAMRWLLSTQLGRRYRPRRLVTLLSPLADPLVVARFTYAALRPDRTWRGRTYGGAAAGRTGRRSGT